MQELFPRHCDSDSIMTDKIPKPAVVEDIVAAVATVLPAGISETVRQNVSSSVKSALENLDFVTRQEIEVQETVLRRARKKITELENRVEQLEKDRGQLK